MSTTEENVVWKGRSHQIVNIWPLVIALLLTLAILWATFGVEKIPGWVSLLALVPLAYGGWLYLGTKLMIYEFTSERMRVYEGVLNQEINEVELYRVKDTRLEKPFWLRLFGLSNIILTTSDRSLPMIEIRAVPNGVEIREKLRKQVELLRDKKRVREVDFESGGDSDDVEFEGGIM